MLSEIVEYDENGERTVSKCGGLVFRAKVSNYMSSKGVGFNTKESLTLLKRDSCMCSYCGAVIDAISETRDDLNCIDWCALVPDNGLKDGHKYKINVFAFNEDEFEYRFEEVK